MNPTILYEDDDVVAIDKPAGLVVHPDGRTVEPTVVDWILAKYPHLKEVGEPLTLASGEVIYRPGIVHRLDRDTSGVLLIAKNQVSFQALKAQFQNHGIKKIYNSFVYGEMTVGEEEVIDRPIAKSRKDFRLWSAQRGSRGEIRDAITNYKVLASTDSGRSDLGFSYMEVEPQTGRTHQIRVHFKAINHPIICDRLYAPKRKPGLGFERLALHSRSLEFTMANGKRLTIEASLPPDFAAAVKKIGYTEAIAKAKAL
jgi:23S rRNA pseudouridine1911/1915/1917 synthase